MEKEYFVLIVEYKNDAPLVFEQYLHHADIQSISDRMEQFQGNPNVIRCAIAKLDYHNGNEALLK